MNTDIVFSSEESKGKQKYFRTSLCFQCPIVPSNLTLGFYCSIYYLPQLGLPYCDVFWIFSPQSPLGMVKNITIQLKDNSVQKISGIQPASFVLYEINWMELFSFFGTIIKNNSFLPIICRQYYNSLDGL